MLKGGYSKVSTGDEDPHESLPEEESEGYNRSFKPYCALLCVVGILSTLALLSSKHVELPKPSVEPIHFTKEELLVLNMQDRAQVNLGDPKKGFSNLNLDNKERRMRDMNDLDKVRVELCGNVLGWRWRQTNYDIGVQYSPNTINYLKWNRRIYNKVFHHERQSKKDEKLIKRYSVQRRICTAPHPRLADTTITVERLGPFRSTGGYDWHTVNYKNWNDYGRLLKGKTVYLLGRMFGVVDANGKPYNYPPFHIHHIHGYPYSPTQGISPRLIPDEYRNKRFGEFTLHQPLVQGHGDAICKDEEGGTACLLDQLPDGQGYRLVNSSGFHMYFEINDVRPAGSPRMEFYFDVAFIHTEKKQIETTFMQLGNPIVGLGWQTYVYPLEPHTNMLYYNFTNDMFGPGTMNDFILHTHMVSFDSMYVFKGQHIYPALEAYRQKNKGELPYIFQCRGQDARTEVKNILKLVSESPGAELVCEGTKPSMVYACQGERCTYRDRRISFNCRKDVRLEQDEVLVVVAFNTVRNTSTISLSRNSPNSEIVVSSPFGMGYATHQHTYFRANFVSDRAREGWMQPGRENATEDIKHGSYAPPAVFRFMSLPVPPPIRDGHPVYGPDANHMISSCVVPMSFKSSLPWVVDGLI